MSLNPSEDIRLVTDLKRKTKEILDQVHRTKSPVREYYTPGSVRGRRATDGATAMALTHSSSNFLTTPSTEKRSSSTTHPLWLDFLSISIISNKVGLCFQIEYL
jgi:hypothetical protein